MRNILVSNREILFSEKTEDGLTRLHLTSVGYHDNRVRFTKKDLQTFKSNFDKGVYGLFSSEKEPLLPLNLGHRFDEEAVGWIMGLELEKEGTELWGLVKLNAEGRDVIENEKYKFASIEWLYDYKDPQGKTHGLTLKGAGLVNTPAVKRLSPAQLAEDDIYDVEQILAWLKTASDDEKLQVVEAAGGINRDSKENKENKKMSENNKTETLQAEVDALKEKNKKLEEEKATREKADQEAAKAAAEQKKKEEFDMLHARGAVVEADREKWMNGELSLSEILNRKLDLNLTGKGSSNSEKGEGGSALAALEEEAKKLYPKWRDEGESLEDFTKNYIKANATEKEQESLMMQTEKKENKEDK